MSDAMYIGATGMQAQQTNIDTIANNLVNISTPGFKKSRVSFTNMMVSEAAQMGSSRSLESVQDEGILGVSPHKGVGVGISNISKIFELGGMTQTSSPWDMAIQGEGFLQVVLPDGNTGYSRGGTLKVNSDGLLATSSGLPLKPNIAIPKDATALTVGTDGSVVVSVPRQAQPIQVGQLHMVRFSDPSSLLAQGDGVYRASANSGEAIPGVPGHDGLGSLQQGVLEGSNVKMVDEMVNLMLAQRTYEASVKVVQAADEMHGMVNNLRK